MQNPHIAGGRIENNMQRNDEYMKLYHELWESAHEISPWYDVDKVKWYSVYIWTKDSEEKPFGGQNVFDILADEICYYVDDHVIPDEAWPVIRRIQEKLREMDGWSKK